MPEIAICPNNADTCLLSRTRPVFACFSQYWPTKDRGYVSPATIICIILENENPETLAITAFHGAQFNDTPT